MTPSYPPPQFESASAAARWVEHLLLVTIVLALLGALMSLDQHGLIVRALNKIPVLHDEAAASDRRFLIVARLRQLAFIITGVLWLRWVFLVARNLRRFGLERLRFSPGWAVGYWFIPLVNLIRPYEILGELLVRSRDRGRLPSGTFRPPGLVGWWWAAYLTQAGLSLVASTRVEATPGIPGLISSIDWRIASDAVCIIAAALAFRLVSDLDRSHRQLQEPAPAASAA